MSQIKGAIFDFDGTIYDSLDFFDNVSYNYLKELYNIIDKDVDYQCEKLTINETVDFINKKHNLNINVEDVRKHFLNNYIKLNAIDRVVDIIKSYYENNVLMIIATVTDKSLVEAALENLNLKKYFIDIITTDMVSSSKEKPVIYDECLKILNLKKENVVVYEDSSYAIKTLLNNNFNVIGVKGKSDLSIFDIEVI